MFHKTKTGISKIHHLKNSKSETQYRKKKHSAVDFRTRVTFAQVYQNTQRELASGQSFGAQYLENVWIDFKTNFIILYLLKHLYWKNKNILKNDVICGDDLWRRMFRYAEGTATEKLSTISENFKVVYLILLRKVVNKQNMKSLRKNKLCYPTRGFNDDFINVYLLTWQ